MSDPDLVWLLNESEGALGLRSSYGPLVDLALSGVTAGVGSGGPRWLSQGRVLAAGAERELRGRWERVDPRLRAVLWLAYGPQPWPSEVRRVSVFGHWPGVLLLSATAQRVFARAVERRAEREAEKRTLRGSEVRHEESERQIDRVSSVPGRSGEDVSSVGQRLRKLRAHETIASGARFSSQAHGGVVHRDVKPENVIGLVPLRFMGIEAPCDHLGPPRDTTLDPVAAMLRRGLGEWLRSPTTSGDKALMSRLRTEARELVAEAHAAWRATSPLAPREPEAKKRRERVQVEEAI